MFDIGWSEMAVIALLTLIVIGPRELPRVLRTVGQWVRKAQSLAREFQRGLDDMAREAELDDAKKLIDTGRNLTNPKKMVMDTLDPTGSVQEEVADLQSAVSSKEPTAAVEPKVESPKDTAVAKAEPTEAPAKKSAAKKTPAKKTTAKKTAPKKAAPKKAAPKKAAAKKAAPKETKAEDVAPKATVIEHPVNMAPPHSVTPPTDPPAKSVAAPESPAKAPAETQAEPQTAGGDGSQKTA